MSFVTVVIEYDKKVEYIEKRCKLVWKEEVK